MSLTTRDPALATLQSHTYTHDNVGNRLTDSRTHAAELKTHTYDTTYQLIESVSNQSPNPFTFTYDRLGNRLSATEHGSQTAYLPNHLNQYTQVGPVLPTYDMNGNLTYDGTNAYTYDSENHLIQVQGSSTAQYAYDYAGRRIRKNVGGNQTYYLYDRDQVIAEYDDTGTLLRKYVYGVGVDEPLVMLTSGVRYFYHSDGLGSITAITNGSGSLVEQYEYTPYGQATLKDPSGTVIPESTIGNSFMFTGREYDKETGLYHYRARTYSPALGRFLQTDPVGYFDSQNLYEYVYNNPVNWIDPWGLCGKKTDNRPWWQRLQDWWRGGGRGGTGKAAGIAGRIYSAIGYKGVGRGLGVAGSVLRGGGPFEIGGRIVGGILGSVGGGALGGVIGTFTGGPVGTGPGIFWGRVIGGGIGAGALGKFGRWLDNKFFR